jgi:osmotically-inducible protein OsmY
LCAAVLFAGIAFNSCGPNDQKLQQAVTTGISAVSSAISSEVKKGEVTLTGVVNSEELKDAAQAAAKSVKGISNVINNIEVKLPEPPKPVINPDDVVQKTIATAITAGGAAFSKVVVAVKDSIVTLTGDVKRTDLKKLMQVVNEAKPKKITNSLTIK